MYPLAKREWGSSRVQRGSPPLTGRGFSLLRRCGKNAAPRTLRWERNAHPGLGWGRSCWVAPCEALPLPPRRCSYAGLAWNGGLAALLGAAGGSSRTLPCPLRALGAPGKVPPVPHPPAAAWCGHRGAVGVGGTVAVARRNPAAGPFCRGGRAEACPGAPRASPTRCRAAVAAPGQRLKRRSDSRGHLAVPSASSSSRNETAESPGSPSPGGSSGFNFRKS